MSYGMSVVGRLDHPSELALERALDTLAAAGTKAVVGLDHVRVEGRTLVVDVQTSAPASTWEPSLIALGALAAFASAGEVRATFHGDTDEVERFGPGRRAASGERHRRWERFFAARDGDVAAVRALLDDGVALDEPLDASGRRMLHVASARDRREVAQLLLARGADANLAAQSGRSPMDESRTAEMRELLLAGGARGPDAVAQKKQMLQALQRRQPELALSLVPGAAPLDAEEAETAVGRILGNGAVELWDALVSMGNDLIGAYRRGHARMVAQDPDIPERLSAWLGTGGSAALLARIVAADLPFSLDRALSGAADGGHVPMLAALFERPGALEAAGDSTDAMHAMCRAARSGRIEAMTFLAERGVPLHPEKPFETSPLLAAASNAAGLPAIHFLAERDVPIAARSTGRETALHRARLGGVANVVALVALGLDLEDPSPSGKRPYELAREERDALVKELRARGLPTPKGSAKSKTPTKK